MGGMDETFRGRTICLTHQLPEDQMSPVGLVCPHCKQRLYTAPPQGRCRAFWESQPMAYSLDGEPCFVYTLLWDDFRIRSLHPPHATEDPRSRIVSELPRPEDSAHTVQEWIVERDSNIGSYEWLDEFQNQSPLFNDDLEQWPPEEDE